MTAELLDVNNESSLAGVPVFDQSSGTFSDRGPMTLWHLSLGKDIVPDFGGHQSEIGDAGLPIGSSSPDIVSRPQSEVEYASGEGLPDEQSLTVPGDAPASANETAGSRRLGRGLRATVLAGSLAVAIAACSPEQIAVYAANQIGLGGALHAGRDVAHAGGEVIHYGGETFRVFNKVSHIGEAVVVYTGVAFGISVRQLVKEGIDCVYVDGVFKGAWGVTLDRGGTEAAEDSLKNTLACQNANSLNLTPGLLSGSSDQSGSNPPPRHTSDLLPLPIDEADAHDEFDPENPNNPWGVQVDGLNDFVILGPDDSMSQQVTADETIGFKDNYVTVYDTVSGGEVQTVTLRIQPFNSVHHHRHHHR